MLPLIAALLTGCMTTAEHEQARREWEMEDHLVAGADVRDAVIRADLAGVHRAAGELEKPDFVPGLDEAHAGNLTAMRDKAGKLAKASDVDAAAGLLTGLSADCQACHHAAKVATPKPLRDTPRELLWTALAFGDDGLWGRAEAGLGDKGAALKAATSWPDRRAAAAAAMRDGTLAGGGQ